MSAEAMPQPLVDQLAAFGRDCGVTRTELDTVAQTLDVFAVAFGLKGGSFTGPEIARILNGAAADYRRISQELPR